MPGSTDIVLFSTCLVDSFFPEVESACFEVLEAAGLNPVLLPGQTCCGQPALNAGFRSEAKAMAMYTIEILAGFGGDIIIPSGSCAAMIRHRYPQIFQGDTHWHPRARQLSDRIFELSEYLVNILGIGIKSEKEWGRLAYHPSCHLLRDLNIDQAPLQLLGAALSEPPIRLEAECCGFGGVFSVEFEPISHEMLKRKLEDIDQADVDTVVACDVSCLMHIEGGLRKQGSAIRCAHLAQILAGKEPGLR